MAKSLALKVRVAAAAAFVVGSALFQPIDVHAAGGELQAKIDKGGTVVVDKDYTGADAESVTIASGKDVTLDLAGHTISNAGNNDTITVEKGAKLTITGNGTVDVTDTINKSAIYNNGTVEIKNGTVNRTSGSDYTILNHGNMTIDYAKVVNDQETKSYMIENGYYDYAGSPNKPKNERMNKTDKTDTEKPTLHIKDGEFKATDKFGAVKNDDNGILTIDGGTFGNKDLIAAAFQNISELTINGGTFTTGGNAIAHTTAYGKYDVGKTVINGGTFVTSPAGAVFNFPDYGDLSKGASLTINGGEFKGELYSSTKVKDDNGNVTSTRYQDIPSFMTLSIAGGNFDDNKENNVLVENYKKEGLEKIMDTDGTVAVGYPVTLVDNGGTGTNVVVYNSDSEKALPTDWTKDGYTFAGWYEKEDFSGEAVTSIAKGSEGAKTYYAKWDKVEAKTDNSKTTKKDKSVTKVKIVAPGVTAPRKASISAPNTGASRLAAFFDAIVAFFANLF